MIFRGKKQECDKLDPDELVLPHETIDTINGFDWDEIPSLGKRLGNFLIRLCDYTTTTDGKNIYGLGGSIPLTGDVRYSPAPILPVSEQNPEQ